MYEGQKKFLLSGFESSQSLILSRNDFDSHLKIFDLQK